MQRLELVRERARRIRRATAGEGRLVRVTWTDDIVETKDLFPLLANDRSLVRLRSDDALFSALQVSEDGGRIVWDGLLAITAVAIARLPLTTMDAGELRAVMAELHLTSDGLAALLGISRRSITDYRGGADIPKAVVLAIRYLTELARR